MRAQLSSATTQAWTVNKINHLIADTCGIEEVIYVFIYFSRTWSASLRQRVSTTQNQSYFMCKLRAEFERCNLPGAPGNCGRSKQNLSHHQGKLEQPKSHRRPVRSKGLLPKFPKH